MRRVSHLPALLSPARRTLSDLGVALEAHRPGDTVEVRFRRGGEARRVQATLGEPR